MNIDPNQAVTFIAAVLAAAVIEKGFSMLKPRLVRAWNAALQALIIEDNS